jgi:predicted NUDIX family phosphoesterase
LIIDCDQQVIYSGGGDMNQTPSLFNQIKKIKLLNENDEEIKLSDQDKKDLEKILSSNF